MSEEGLFVIYEVEEEGRNKLDIGMEELGFYLSPEKALIIVREDLRRIFFWKGAKSSVKKRFLGSREATSVQSDLMKDGYHRCKIMTVDQGDEPEEFLNVFGLESMEVTETLEDVKILRNSEREKLRQEKVLATKVELSGTSKLDEIKKLCADDEKILWIKSVKGILKKNWLKTLLKDKRYKDRVKHLKKADDIQLTEYDNRYVITNKQIIVNSIFNGLYDFSKIPGNIFKLEGDKIALLDLRGVDSFEVENSKGSYDVWINAEPLKTGAGIFLFENLTKDEYEKFLDVFTAVVPLRAEVPKDIKIKYIRKKT